MKRKRKILSFILAVCLIVGLLPATALAGAVPTSVKLGTVEMVNGTNTTYWVNESAAAVTAEPAGGWNAKLEWSNGTPILTLDGAEISGELSNPGNAGIYANGDLEIVLTGSDSNVGIGEGSHTGGLITSTVLAAMCINGDLAISGGQRWKWRNTSFAGTKRLWKF